MSARFRNGERILYLTPFAGWRIAEVTGEAQDGAYLADEKAEDFQIAGAVPAGADEAALLERLDAIRERRQAAVVQARKDAWDEYHEALEEAAIERVPGILPGFGRS